jgi:CRISPR system Cascade subunit CasE
MVRLVPDMARVVRWAAAEGLLPGDDADLGYPLHAALAAAFGELAPKPFALERRPGRDAALLGYTPHPLGALRDRAAAFASPEVVTLLALDSMADKAMPEFFAPGTRLGFALRARPTVRTDRDGDRSRTRERDAAAPGEDRGAAYARWLAPRLEEGGARPLRITLDAYRSARVRRRDASRRLRAVEGPDASFSGTLDVTDPAAFAALLARGVGRHRTFGFGMLLLRPA